LGYATIQTPVAGVLISRNVEPGDLAQPSKALMTLSPLGDTQLVVQIDEKNLALLALGQKAQASADAFSNERFQAELSFINPGVDAQRGSVEVKLRVPQPPAYLKQDMTVSVEIEVARKPQALVLPTAAVHDFNSRFPWVFKVVNGKVKKTAVALGLRSANLCEVLEGLDSGDAVVLSTPKTLQHQARVRITAS
jgi:HlyD family secretion protein